MTPKNIANSLGLKTYNIENYEVQLYQDPEVWLPYSASSMLSFLIREHYLEKTSNKRVLDVGTGSGIIGIMCGLLGANEIYLSDYCKAASDMAEKNALQNGIQAKGIQSDRFEKFKGQQFDFIISNPPVQPWLFTNSLDQEHRINSAAWNEAGNSGRLVLDSLIQESKVFLSEKGKVITSCSSRHGHQTTINLLNQHWPNQWQEIFISEHQIDTDYHQPYMTIWKNLQANDFDLRVYQKDHYGQRFSYQKDKHNVSYCLTHIEHLGQKIPVKIYEELGQSRVFNQENEKILDLNKGDQRLPGASIDDQWYYTYHLLCLEL